MKLRYTPRAKLDLAEIHDYIAQENTQAARRVLQLIRKAADTLLKNSQLGRTGRIAGTRELTVGRFPFMLAYRIEAEEIHLAVVHTSRLWPEKI